MTLENKPVYSMSYGNLQVTIWGQNAEIGSFRVCFNRRYVDVEKDTWCNSKYFLENDLPVIAKAALDIHTWILNQKNTDMAALKLPTGSGDDEEMPSMEN